MKSTLPCLEEQIEEVKEDYPEDISVQLIEELKQENGTTPCCWYDPKIKKIVYCSAKCALQAYLCHAQRKKIEEYKWLESEREHRDVGEQKAGDEFTDKFAEAYAAFWRRTHKFIPPESGAA